MYNLLHELCAIHEAKKKLVTKLTSAYKKGLKKHKNDKRLAKALKDVLKAFTTGTDIPAEYNPHMFTHGRMKGIRTVHLVGQQIVMIYKIDGDVVTLLGLGSHKEVGTM